MCIKFCVKLGRNGAETFEMLRTAFGADSPRPKKARQVQSNVKVMLIVFFDMEGIVHYEYVPKAKL